MITKPIIVPKMESVEVHKKIEKLLKEFNNKESEIPLGHDYWNLSNEYRKLKSEGK